MYSRPTCWPSPNLLWVSVATTSSLTWYWSHPPSATLAISKRVWNIFLYFLSQSELTLQKKNLLWEERRKRSSYKHPVNRKSKGTWVNTWRRTESISPAVLKSWRQLVPPMQKSSASSISWIIMNCQVPLHSPPNTLKVKNNVAGAEVELKRMLRQFKDEENTK